MDEGQDVMYKGQHVMEEIIYLIALLLSESEFLRINLVSKLWYELHRQADPVWEELCEKKSQLMKKMKPDGENYRTLYYRWHKCKYLRNFKCMFTLNPKNVLVPSAIGVRVFAKNGNKFDREGHAFAFNMSMNGRHLSSRLLCMHGNNKQGGVVNIEMPENPWTYTIEHGVVIPRIVMTLYVVQLGTKKLIQLSKVDEEHDDTPLEDGDTQMITSFLVHLYELIPEVISQTLGIVARLTLCEDVQTDDNDNKRITLSRIQIHFQTEEGHDLTDMQCDYAMCQLIALNKFV